MTTISILNDDFEILFADEVLGTATTGMKMVRRAAGASETVYTTNQLYSAIAESTDEFIAMGFKNPMLPVTPNAYTMENDYFLPRSSTEYLKEGAIDADWGVTSTTGVIRKVYDTPSPAFVSGDIGQLITEADSGPDTGTLLDFEIEPDGTTVLWIRPDDPATDLFDATTGLIVSEGTGSANAIEVAISGRTLFSSIQAIGSVPTATEVYLYQNRFKMTDSSGAFQWWATDPNVSLGIIDILVRVISADVIIADGDVEVFSRRYTSLYDNFRLNVVAGGRSALPLASAVDINNTTGYRTTGTMTGGGGTWTVGNGIYQGGSGWGDATARGVITKVGAGPEIEYYIVGDLTDLSATTASTEHIFSTGVDGDATGTTSGTIDDVVAGPTGTLGATVTFALGGFLVDHDGDAATEPYSVQIDCQDNVPIAIVYEVMKYVTRRGATADLFTGANIPGEAYRGLDGLIEYTNPTGTLTEGDDILSTTSTNTWTARLLHQNTSNSPTYIVVTDQQTSVDSISNTHVIEDEAGGQDVEATTTSLGIFGITSPKSSPFGTFTGSQIFGARGVSFVNLAANPQNYTLTDDLGTLRTSPNLVTFTVNNVREFDKIFLARDTTVLGVINKDQFSGLGTQSGSNNGLGDVIVLVAGTIDPEVSAAAEIRIVETTLLQEHHYVYSSRVAGAGGTFALKAITNSPFTHTGGTETDRFIDDGENFVDNGVEVGMMLRNTFGGKTAHVWEITGFAQTGATPNDTLLISPLYGSPDDIDGSDTCEINALIQDYTTSDNVFDLIIDREVTAGEEAADKAVGSFVQSTTFNTVINVRQGKVILPFSQNPGVNASGGSATVVRTPDTIAV